MAIQFSCQSNFSKVRLNPNLLMYFQGCNSYGRKFLQRQYIKYYPKECFSSLKTGLGHKLHKFLPDDNSNTKPKNNFSSIGWSRIRSRYFWSYRTCHWQLELLMNKSAVDAGTPFQLGY